MSAREVPIEYAGAAPLAADLAATLRRQVTLGDVMKWGFSLMPPRSPTEIVTQDEYTHDVVLELTPECWLVFDTT